MKCNKCQAEWNVQKDFDNCPFCGASLKPPVKQGNFETVDEFFSYALETFGLGLLSDSRKLISYLTDLAPTLTREKNILRMAIESGVYKEILSANGESDSEKENCFTRCKIILVDNYFLQSEWADKVLHWLTDYLGWKVGKENSAESQQTAVATPTSTQKKEVFGQLVSTLQTTIQRKNDIKVGSLQHLISAGDYHAVGLKNDGTVISAGNNGDGKCNISFWRDIVSVSASFDHTVGLKKDGTVVAVGSNIFDQCDISLWRDIVAVSATGFHTVGLKKDGTVVAAGSNKYGQCNVSLWRDIVAVSAGYYHTVGLKNNGTVVAVGSDVEGKCDVSSWRDIVAVSANFFHTVGLKKDGTVVVEGSNNYGQCNASSWRDIVEVSAGVEHTVGLKKDGTVVAVGSNKYGQCDVSLWRNIIAVSAGGKHTIGLKKDGTVVATGDNYFGQCNVSSWKLF